MSQSPCPVCGRVHEELPIYAFEGPAFWKSATPEERERDFRMGPDLCRYKDEHFLIRTRLQVPIKDSPGEALEFGVWVAVSRQNYNSYRTVYLEIDASRMGVFYGWLANALPGYPNTVNLKVAIAPQNDRMRPFVKVIENHEHPLQGAQEDGITRDEAQRYLHERGDF